MRRIKRKIDYLVPNEQKSWKKANKCGIIINMLIYGVF